MVSTCSFGGHYRQPARPSPVDDFTGRLLVFYLIERTFSQVNALIGEIQTFSVACFSTLPFVFFEGNQMPKSIGDPTTIEKAFAAVVEDLKRAPKDSDSYWSLVRTLKTLADNGYKPASRYVRAISKAELKRNLPPANPESHSTWTHLLEGPRTTSFKGARRQLQADPDSPHKTFGMAPRKEKLDDI